MNYEEAILKKECKHLTKHNIRNFIKTKYPIGSCTLYPNNSDYYYITNRSVFEYFVFEYSDRFRPDSIMDYEIEFMVRRAGTDTMCSLRSYRVGEIIAFINS